MQHNYYRIKTTLVCWLFCKIIRFLWLVSTSVHAINRKGRSKERLYKIEIPFRALWGLRQKKKFWLLPNT